MTGFRGSDEELDGEIHALEQIARVRLRRTVRDFAELERDLKELRRERVRRRQATAVPSTFPATEGAEVTGRS